MSSNQANNNNRNSFNGCGLTSRDISRPKMLYTTNVTAMSMSRRQEEVEREANDLTSNVNVGMAAAAAAGGGGPMSMQMPMYNGKNQQHSIPLASTSTATPNQYTPAPMAIPFAVGRHDISVSVVGSPLDTRITAANTALGAAQRLPTFSSTSQQQNPSSSQQLIQQSNTPILIPKKTLTVQQYQGLLDSLATYNLQISSLAKATEGLIEKLQEFADVVPSARGGVWSTSHVQSLDFLIDSSQLIGNAFETWSGTLQTTLLDPLNKDLLTIQEKEAKREEERRRKVQILLGQLEGEEEFFGRVKRKGIRDEGVLQKSINVRKALQSEISLLSSHQYQQTQIQDPSDRSSHKRVPLILERLAASVKGQETVFETIVEGFQKMGHGADDSEMIPSTSSSAFPMTSLIHLSMSQQPQQFIQPSQNPQTLQPQMDKSRQRTVSSSSNNQSNPRGIIPPPPSQRNPTIYTTTSPPNPQTNQSNVIFLPAQQPNQPSSPMVGNLRPISMPPSLPQRKNVVVLGNNQQQHQAYPQQRVTLVPFTPAPSANLQQPQQPIIIMQPPANSTQSPSSFQTNLSLFKQTKIVPTSVGTPIALPASQSPGHRPTPPVITSASGGPGMIRRTSKLIHSFTAEQEIELQRQQQERGNLNFAQRPKRMQQPPPHPVVITTTPNSSNGSLPQMESKNISTKEKSELDDDEETNVSSGPAGSGSAGRTNDFSLPSPDKEANLAFLREAMSNF